MTDPADGFGESFRALRLNAWDRNVERARALRRFSDTWRATGMVGGEDLRGAIAVAHSLRGSAGTFGDDEASQAALAIEQLLHRAAVDAGCPVSLDDRVSDLEASLRHRPER